MEAIYQYVLAHKDSLSEIVLAAIALARLVAALTPSKKDDDAVSGLERGFRKAVSLVSGANHKDPTQTTPGEASPAVQQDDDFAVLLDEFNRVLRAHGAELKVVPIEKKD